MIGRQSALIGKRELLGMTNGQAVSRRFGVGW